MRPLYLAASFFVGALLGLTSLAGAQSPVIAEATLFETGCGNMALTEIVPPVLGRDFQVTVNSRNNLAAFLALGAQKRDRSTAIPLGSVPNPFFPGTRSDCLVYTLPLVVVGLPIDRPFPGVGLSRIKVPIPDERALLGLSFVIQAASTTKDGFLWLTPGLACRVGDTLPG